MAYPTYNTSLITAINHAQQGLPFAKWIIGGKGGSGGTTFNLQKKSTTYAFSLWRSRPFLIGQPFKFCRARIRTTADITTNHTITPVLGIDDGSTITEGTAINSTNYTNSERYITLNEDTFAGAVHGNKNFWLEFRFSGSVLVGIDFPIDIEIETETV